MFVDDWSLEGPRHRACRDRGCGSLCRRKIRVESQKFQGSNFAWQGTLQFSKILEIALLNLLAAVVEQDNITEFGKGNV